jgi:hypothetical protein
MKPQRRIDYLSFLRQEIAALSVVKCHMAHERVLRDPVSTRPLPGRMFQGSYQRVGLCTPETRAQRLGCSHTMARFKLADAIDVLEQLSEACTSSLADELNLVNNEIHLLDHRKGDAEKRLATIWEYSFAAEDRSHLNEQLRKAEAELRVLEQLHDEYVDRVGLIRDKVLGEMDRMLQEVAQDPAFGDRAGEVCQP